ncbi:hypothetical protein [Caldibacillus thermoamylovorans]|uniref:hypothetical protein n=1 Tax=Caldibacillus thermoamylovorans TaxID=35841 RepID=UPI001269CA06|nr:hypothetical protein [Caldibacillus thermoamylovorans]
MAMNPVLVVILRRKEHYFGDEIHSRRHFLAGNSFFWRRDPFSSSFFAGTPIFWRRGPFSSSI